MKSDCIFRRAIVKIPCKNMVHGITAAGLGEPDYEVALSQHEQYVRALKISGLDVTILPPDERYPDSTFVEDTALLIPECAIITNPGAHSRRGEITNIKKVLNGIYYQIEQVQSPGTVDGGDILMVEDHYYIGLSDRTNIDGARQIIEILKKYGKAASTINVKNLLHLKSGIAYLGNNHLLMDGAFQNDQLSKKFKVIRTGQKENYAANCLRINDYVLFPKGFDKTKFLVEKAGFTILEVDVSEFRKLDGGVSCLSLRF